MIMKPSKVDTFEEVVNKARANPPDEDERKPTVSAFRGWVYRLCVPIWARSKTSQDIGAWMEREVEDRYRHHDAPNLPSHLDVIHRDRLDHSQPGKMISSLSVNGQPLVGLPDLVCLNRLTKEIVILEKKTTTRWPADWHDLRVQLWCYGHIDEYRSFDVVRLCAGFYHPFKDPSQKPQLLKSDWRRGGEPFESQCRTLFELYGGKVIY
jgi:hypothetical protein